MKVDVDIIMRKLGDYLILNGYGLKDSGLYKGRAGISLSLFEAAKFLRDEKLEEAACLFLEQSLLTKVRDISFENGLSGIAYVLHFLIRHKFVDANFNDLYGIQMAFIVEQLNSACDDKIFINKNLNFVKINHLFQYYKNVEAEQALTKICHIVLSLYADKWEHIGNNPLGHHAIDLVMQEWKYILSAICKSSFYHPDISFFIPFVDLYKKGRIKYDNILFGYLHQIAIRENFIVLSDFIATYKQANDSFLIKGWDFVDIILENGYEIYSVLRTKLLQGNWDDIENTINRLIFNSDTRLGYQGGIAWLLLLMVYNHPSNENFREIKELFF